LEEPAVERLSGRQCDGPGIYIHVIPLDEESMGCYVGKSDSNIKQRLKTPQFAQDDHYEGPLYRLKRSLASSHCYEKALIKLPGVVALKKMPA
jgi:hypothetical protein